MARYSVSQVPCHPSQLCAPLPTLPVQQSLPALKPCLCAQQAQHCTKSSTKTPRASQSFIGHANAPTALACCGDHIVSASDAVMVWRLHADLSPEAAALESGHAARAGVRAQLQEALPKPQEAACTIEDTASVETVVPERAAGQVRKGAVSAGLHSSGAIALACKPGIWPANHAVA